jgi:GDP-L-fucose synthase
MLKVFLAGHRGLVGSALNRYFVQKDDIQIVTVDRAFLDLRDSVRVAEFLNNGCFDYVIDAAAVVGGISANQSYPYKFIMDNMLIQNSLINGAVTAGIKNFIFLGSSCIYPRHALQPIKEEYLLTGPLEQTNEWYAVAKISGVKACEAIKLQFGYNYVCLMPTNLYGPEDNFDLTTSHVLPALIRKFHDAKINGSKTVELWGTGKPRREFLHVNDLARAVDFILRNKCDQFLYNVGVGYDLTILELSEVIMKIVDLDVEIHWNSNMPDGTPQKLLDSSRINNLGWEPEIFLEEGIRQTYAWFNLNNKNLRTINFSRK